MGGASFAVGAPANGELEKEEPDDPAQVQVQRSYRDIKSEKYRKIRDVASGSDVISYTTCWP